MTTPTKPKQPRVNLNAPDADETATPIRRANSAKARADAARAEKALGNLAEEVVPIKRSDNPARQNPMPASPPQVFEIVDADSSPQGTEDEWGDVSTLAPEKSDFSKFSETLLDDTNLRGKTNLTDEQVTMLTVLETMEARYDFLKAGDLTKPFMHLLTSKRGWSRNSLTEAVKGRLEVRDKESMDAMRGGPSQGY